jgi:hypothetical protein
VPCRGPRRRSGRSAPWPEEPAPPWSRPPSRAARWRSDCASRARAAPSVPVSLPGRLERAIIRLRMTGQAHMMDRWAVSRAAVDDTGRRRSGSTKSLERRPRDVLHARRVAFSSSVKDGGVDRPLQVLEGGGAHDLRRDGLAQRVAVAPWALRPAPSMMPRGGCR